MVRSFLKGLFLRLRQKQLSPAPPPHAALPPAEHPLQAAYLEGIIRARNAGDPELSLRLIDAAREMGLNTPWLRDNEARGLVDLGRRGEAMAIWHDLLTNEDRALAEMAERMLQELRRSEQQEMLQMQRNRIETLLTICREAGWEPSRLLLMIESEALLPAEELEKGVLEEVIAIRDEGDASLSLAVIANACNQGLESPWLRDNEARALVNLGHRSEALAIWEDLAAADDQLLAALAREMCERQHSMLERERLQQQHNRLDALRQVCSEGGWAGGHLEALESRLEEASPEEILYAVLKEVIAVRESGNPQLSLQLITTAREQGIDSPWLHDNQARALVRLGRSAEAHAIWQELSEHGEASLAATAREMVALRHQQAIRRESVLEEAKNALRERCFEDAIRNLSEALIDDPDCQAFHNELCSAIEQRDHAGPSHASGSVERNLNSSVVKLGMFESLLERIEDRFHS
jgi:hypothetical protein